MTGSGIRYGVSSAVTGETQLKCQSDDDDDEFPINRNDIATQNHGSHGGDTGLG